MRAWAPRCHTPILRVSLTHDHLASIAGLTPDGRLLVQSQHQSSHSAAVVRFLRVLLRKISGKLLLIWDGAPNHRGQPIKEFLARGAAKRLHLEQLPGYAPALNPVEGVWNCLELSQAGGTGQCLLPRDGGAESGAAAGQRAPAPQTPRLAWVYCRVQLSCLDLYADSV